MTDEQRKILTEEVFGEVFMPGLVGKSYSHDGETRSNCTFTDADMMALFRKLVDSLNFGAFQNFAYKRFDDPKNYTLTEWLFYDQSRFCSLVAQWLEARK